MYIYEPYHKCSILGSQNGPLNVTRVTENKIAPLKKLFFLSVFVEMHHVINKMKIYENQVVIVLI